METFTLAVLCDLGCEEYLAAEVEELIKKRGEPRKGYIAVPGCSPSDAALLCYRSQLAARVLVLIREGSIESPEDVVNDEVLSFDYASFIAPGMAFRAECERTGEHGFQSPEVETAIADAVNERFGYEIRLKRPDVELFVRVRDDSFVLGVDLSGRDLGKRDYKVFHTRQSIRATIGAAALRAAGYDKRKVLVDPFVIDSTLLIEAALQASGASPQKFKRDFAFMKMPAFSGTDWEKLFDGIDGKAKLESRISGFSPLLRTLKMGRQNAKLAGIDDALSLTRCDLSWLDTKVAPKSVDLFVTVPPSSGKSNPLKDVEKLQDDLFNQVKQCLKKGGAVLLLAEKKAEFLNAAERHGFELSDERQVWMGGKDVLLLRFERAA